MEQNYIMEQNYTNIKDIILTNYGAEITMLNTRNEQGRLFMTLEEVIDLRNKLNETIEQHALMGQELEKYHRE